MTISVATTDKFLESQVESGVCASRQEAKDALMSHIMLMDIDEMVESRRASYTASR